MERVENSEATDDALVARCRNGDEAAFDELVLRHRARAINVAFQVVRDYEDATEVAQDAFVNVYEHLDSFRGDCAFTTWLHQIVLNLARNRHRWWKRRGRQAMVSLDATIETPDGDAPRQFAAAGDAPDTAAVKAEFVTAIAREMAALPLAFREVLMLRNVDNLSYEEIAGRLDVSVGTVKSRIARAREALRERMKDELR